MRDVLCDPIWQSLGTIVGIIALAVSVTIGIITISLSRRRKALSYEVLAMTRLVTLDKDIRERVEILFDGQLVKDVKLALIRLTNSGDLPIRATDFEHPVTLSFNEEARILTAAATETNPQDLNVSLDVEPAKVTIRPSLLNPNDSVTVKILATEVSDSFSVSGRIVGVDAIRKQKPEVNRLTALMSLCLITFNLICLAVATAIVPKGFKFFTLFFVVMAIASILYSYKWMRKGK